MVRDINPGSGNSFPGSFRVANGILFFTATTSTAGTELWKTDGTEAGTVLVRDIAAGTASSFPGDLVEYEGSLYFRANDGINGGQLWKSDGTESGTVPVTALNTAGTGFNPYGLIVNNGLLYFGGSSADNGTELWKSDGTSAGTVLIRDINPGTTSSSPNGFVRFLGMIYFTAEVGSTGRELWRTDGTEAGTVLIKDIAPGGAGSGAGNLMVAGNTLYFTANDLVAGTELWKTDGTESGTVLVQDLNPGTAQSQPTNLVVVSDKLFMGASTDDLGRELFVLALPSTLPVTLAQFTARKNGEQALLSWSTASEQNNKGFHIQRSANGRDFTNIAFATARGNGSGADYSFTDAVPLSGRNFYRLQQEDEDGKTSLSAVRTLDFRNAMALSLYPNPVQRQLTLTLGSTAGALELQLTDLQGRPVQQWKYANPAPVLQLDLGNLPAGMYLLTLRDAAGSIQTVQVLKQ